MVAKKIIEEIAQRAQTPVNKDDVEDFISSALSRFGFKGDKLDYLGSGAYNSAWDIGDNRVLKFGEEESYRPQDLEGQLEPLFREAREVKSSWPWGRQGGIPMQLGVYPKAETFSKRGYGEFLNERYRAEAEGREPDYSSLDPSTRRMGRILAARSKERQPLMSQSLLGRSYVTRDLHQGNLGITPEGEVVSIDAGAGLLPQNFSEGTHRNYPRRGYIVGPNILERWADEIHRGNTPDGIWGLPDPYTHTVEYPTELPTLTPELAAVLRRLSGWDIKHEL